MPQDSAGILLYRRRGAAVEVFLVHPGGPFWTRKDEGAWSIAKGELEPGENPIACAKREFAEETGLIIDGVLKPLAPVRQAGGKVVYAWAVEGDADASAIKSTTFSLEWPLRSGRMQEFPEVDRAAWFEVAVARQKINKGQRPMLDELEKLLSV
jgi:predicted NUDIX family NTP pyrophosphohydrolase